MHTHAYDYLGTLFHMPSANGSLEWHRTETQKKFPPDRLVFILHSTKLAYYHNQR
jgi:hypothetical protein